MRRALNDAWLGTVEPPNDGRLEVWDTRIPGLVLRFTPSGAASWSVRARTRDDTGKLAGRRYCGGAEARACDAR